MDPRYGVFLPQVGKNCRLRVRTGIFVDANIFAMSWTTVLITAAIVVGALAGGVVSLRWVGPYGSIPGGAAWLFARIYSRLIHRVRITGAEHLKGRSGPLIVVANHTAGVDPVLVSASAPFVIRWVMAEDMRLPEMEWFWRWQRVIFVGRDREAAGRRSGSQDRDASRPDGVRESIRHLKDNGVLGIFPEGGIERPPKQVLPFLRGIGLIISKTKAPVLPVVIDGTPQVDPAWASLWRTSRSTIAIHPPIDYSGMKASEIVEDLQRRYLEWTGWPLNESPSQELAEARHKGKASGRAGRAVPAKQG